MVITQGAVKNVRQVWEGCHNQFRELIYVPTQTMANTTPQPLFLCSSVCNPTPFLPWLPPPTLIRYRAPELCGSFFAKYSPAIDLWGVGCIFAEVG